MLPTKTVGAAAGNSPSSGAEKSAKKFGVVQ